jgi:FKBP-type peptidyl-prolyl cis-trans isomerase FklB
MNRGIWTIAAIGGIGLVAGTFLSGCEDQAASNTPDVAVATADSRASQAEANKKKGEEFLAANAKKEGVKTLPSGLQYLVLKEGTGKKPGPTDEVEVHYHGTLIDGTVFDSSVDRGEPATFPVNRVIPGWTEALQLMKEGAKWRVFIPSKHAYRQRGFPPKIGPNETLIFEIELLHVK